jgi:hypothetical protein
MDSSWASEVTVEGMTGFVAVSAERAAPANNAVRKREFFIYDD